FSLLGETEEEQFLKPPEVKTKRSQLEILFREKELLGFFLTGHPLDTYRGALQRLSCVPLSHVESAAHDFIFRAAFHIESASIKISAKSQRKFAILTISDGFDRFELPVWSDTYEEKPHLFKENQLLYAVLQVDKKEETPKLS